MERDGNWEGEQAGGYTGNGGLEHAWKGVCVRCEGTGEKHEAGVRGQRGRGTREAKGSGRRNGARQGGVG